MASRQGDERPRPTSGSPATASVDDWIYRRAYQCLNSTAQKWTVQSPDHPGWRESEIRRVGRGRLGDRIHPLARSPIWPPEHNGLGADWKGNGTCCAAHTVAADPREELHPIVRPDGHIANLSFRNRSRT